MHTAVVFGGYGTFGSHVVRELAGQGIRVTVAGPDRTRAEAFAQALGSPHRALVADVSRPESCRNALRGQAVAVNCAGPFGPFDSTLLQSCLEAGCHYVDIADDRGYTAMVRGHDERFRQQGLAAVYGCSSLPAISGALALVAAESAVVGQVSKPAALAKIDRARVTLFVGNDNPKGPAAVRSVVFGLGKPIQAPQGIIKGFRDREVVWLPPPFGKRAVFNFDSPEYDLFPPMLDVRRVTVKLGFELSLANYALALMAVLSSDFGNGTAGFFQWLGNNWRGHGTSGGAVMTELFFADGSLRRATMLARHDGQRMAALPCAFVAQALSTGTHSLYGAMTAYEFLGAATLLDRLRCAGFELQL